MIKKIFYIFDISVLFVITQGNFWSLRYRTFDLDAVNNVVFNKGIILSSKYAIIIYFIVIMYDSSTILVN